MQLIRLVSQIPPDLRRLTLIVATSTTTTTSSSSTATETVSTLSSLVKLISDFGVEIVITAVMVIFMYRYMKNLIKRDNELYESIIPKVEGLSTSIKSMESDINKLVSNHNTHSNAMLRALEKDQDEIRDIVFENQNQLRNLAAKVAALQSNQDIMLRMIAALNSYNMSRTISGGEVIDFTQPEGNSSVGDKPSGNSDPQTKK